MKARAIAFRAVTGLLIASGGSAASAACDNRELTVGSGPEVAAEGGTPTTGTVWSGYVERFAFKSGSDRITVTFTSPTTGTVVFGEVPAEPLAVDPSVPYPPGCSFSTNWGSPAPDDPVRCAERFAFTMRDAVAEAERLRFTVDVTDMWSAWCEGQTLITATSWFGGTGQPAYSCAGVAPGKGGNCKSVIALPDGGPQMEVSQDGAMPIPPGANDPVDCELEATCGRFCGCTMAGCEKRGSILVSFDLHVDGKEASGSSDLGTVHLKAQ